MPRVTPWTPAALGWVHSSQSRSTLRWGACVRSVLITGSDTRGNKMVTTREQQAFDRAVEAARRKATLETLAELRAFTGIETYVPDHTAPEHVAYLGYEQDLANGLQVWTGHEVSSKQSVDRLIERRNAASRAVDEELERRMVERADRNVALRVPGKVQDLAIREKAHLRDVEKRLEHAWADLHHAEDRVREI